MTEEHHNSPAFDDALQNLGHALLTEDPARELVHVLETFRNEHRGEVLTESLVELEGRFREHARNAVMPEYRSAYSAAANEIHKLATELPCACSHFEFEHRRQRPGWTREACSRCDCVDYVAAQQGPASEKVKHSGPETRFCVLCLSGEHERVDEPAPTGRTTWTEAADALEAYIERYRSPEIANWAGAVAFLRDRAARTQQLPEAFTLCSNPPCDHDGSGELCDIHETEQAHAEGDHGYCGPTCEVKFPSGMLRNTILYRAIPGSAGMLAELERRAAAGRPAPVSTSGNDLRCMCGDPIELMDKADPTSWIHSPGSDTPCLDARPADLFGPGTPAPAPPDLREVLAEALVKWAGGNNSPQYASMRRPEVVRENAYGRTDAVLAALLGYLDVGEAEAWCKICRRAWEGPHHSCASDAERRLARAREVHLETCPLATGKVKPTAFTCGLCEALEGRTSSGVGVASSDG